MDRTPFRVNKIKPNNKIKIKESDILKSCLEYLACRPGKWWRNNTGGMVTNYKGKSHFFRYGLVGSSDIFGILPPSGQFIAIECKGTGGKQSDAQKDFQKEVEDNGGTYILAYSLDDLIQRGL